MRILAVAVVSCAITLCSAPHALAADVCAIPSNFVQNCGFETGNFSNWTISGTDSAATNNGIFYGVENIHQFSGSWAAYFGAVGGEITLSQTLNNLIPSFIYTVTIEAFNDTTPDTGYINNIILGLGGTSGQVASQVASDGYTLYSFPVGATATSELLSISSRNDAGFWNIDSIEVLQTGTPEPATLPLFGIGLLVLAGSYLVSRLKRV